MNDKEAIIYEFYNILVQIRYPKITTATVEDVESIILKRENRVSLLSWILIQKSPSVATELEKLESPVLEGHKLYEYYSGIGICIDKQLLLGNCTWQEQSSTLKLLLDFMKCLYIESFNVDDIQKERINDTLNVYTNKGSRTIMSNTKRNLSYFKSLQYFDNLQKYIGEHEELIFNYESQKKQHTGENEGEKKIIYEDDSYLLFNIRMKKFIQVFSTIGSQSVANVKGASNNLHSMENVIKEICSNVSSITEFLQAKEEISNAAIPKGLNKMTTPLNEIIEDIVSSSEKVLTIYKT